MRIRIVMAQIIGHRIHNLTRDLCASGAIEVSDRLSGVPSGEGRELRANGFNRGEAEVGGGSGCHRVAK
jgi:hypothetical protein